MSPICKNEPGFALITVLMLLALIMSLVLGYFTMTRIDTSTTRSSMDSFRGFYAAEAGLNLRANQVRQIFVGYNRPAGAAPNTGSGQVPCATGNTGNGDFSCASYNLEGRDAQTFLEEPPSNPTSIVIPRGEAFQNLNAQEYRYVVYSEARSPENRPEAVLQMHFKSRLVPMFQFAAFYNKDLEILPGPTMTLAGPVHANGDLYLGSNNSLDIEGQVTTASNLWRGRKDQSSCMTGPVRVADPENQTEIQTCVGTTQLVDPAGLAAWNGMIEVDIDEITVPPPEALDPVPGEIYWDKADIRVMLDMNLTPPAVQVRNTDGSVNALDTATLATCGAVAHTTSFHNNREGLDIDMLDVDVERMLDCIHDNALMGVGKGLDESSEGGLVFYLGVDGPDTAGQNHYGVRAGNAGELASTSVGAPDIQGLTVVTNQAMYVWGNYNATNKKPAAFLADSINILSEGWTDADDSLHVTNDAGRDAQTTTIHAAFLAGTDTTGGVEGTGGQFSGNYNGGLENYPRFHEDWSGVTLTYLGSFVSLNTPRHVDGGWVYGHPQYRAPNRDWGYDTDFDDAANLPPLSPRFVYLRQELFVRRFEL